jgi:hypothetical protein
MGLDLTFLKTDSWFEQGHDHVDDKKVGWGGHWRPIIHPAKYVWTPLVALEELWKA